MIRLLTLPAYSACLQATSPFPTSWSTCASPPEDNVTTIGRDPANGIFLNDMTVSRSHARIIREGLGARIEDLGSLNGTWVDGAIVNAAPLHDGSSVQIGTFTLIYHESTPERIETGE